MVARAFIWYLSVPTRPLSCGMNDLRNLKVLDAAHLLAAHVHTAAAALDGRASPGLRSQLLRAVNSVPANIAEGARQNSRPQFLRYLRIARASLDETSAHLRVAADVGAIRTPEIWQCRSTLAVVASMLHRLIESIEEHESRMGSQVAS
jgi:four helix bundle protein